MFSLYFILICFFFFFVQGCIYICGYQFFVIFYYFIVFQVNANLMVVTRTRGRQNEGTRAVGAASLWLSNHWAMHMESMEEVITQEGTSNGTRTRISPGAKWSTAINLIVLTSSRYPCGCTGQKLIYRTIMSACRLYFSNKIREIDNL